MNLTLILTSIVGLIEGFLAVLIYIRDHKDKVNRAFIFLLVAILAWVVPIIFYSIGGEKDVVWFWTRILYVGPLFIPTSFIYFIYAFLRNLERRKEIFLLIILFVPNIVLAIITLFSHLILQDVVVSSSLPVYITFASFYPWYVAYFLIFFGWSYILLFKNFSRNILRNAQIFYILAGSFTASIIGMVTNLLLPYFGNFTLFWVGPVATLIFAVFIIYAIVTHHILNISIVSTEMFTGILIILLLLNVFTFSSPQDLFFKTAIFVGGTIIGLLLVTRSLRELRQLQQIETLNLQLQKSIEELQKLDELKTDFVSLASHQLRTPLTPIKGFSDMLRKGDVGSLTPEQHELADKIFFSSERMVELIDDLLDVSKLEKEGGFTYNFSVGNPSDLIKGVVDELQSQAKGKGLSLSFDLKLLPDVKVKFDAQKLKDAVENVVTNAIKYTLRGNIWVKAVEDGEWVVISVKDTGVGIDKDDMPKIFQKFFRGKEVSRLVTEGTGLGLYFTRRVIEDHGGHIWVESEGLEKGSEFIIKLPKV
ncbi:MAG: hypothetical protein HY001_03125 [Candidatus Portnoybacteria bacterium]|nr:hypothetical protein [Candidatus Portnoybacteria bacterium]